MPIKRIDILQALVNRLKDIDGTGSYHTDLETRVYHWQVVPFKEDELPALNVKDPERTYLTEGTQGPYNIHDSVLHISIEASVVGTDGHIRASEIEADVNTAIKQDPTFGGLAFDMLPVSSHIASDHEDRKVLGITLEYELHFRTKRLTED